MDPGFYDNALHLYKDFTSLSVQTLNTESPKRYQLSDFVTTFLHVSSGSTLRSIDGTKSVVPSAIPRGPKITTGSQRHTAGPKAAAVRMDH